MSFSPSRLFQVGQSFLLRVDVRACMVIGVEIVVVVVA